MDHLQYNGQQYYQPPVVACQTACLQQQQQQQQQTTMMATSNQLQADLHNQQQILNCPMYPLASDFNSPMIDNNQAMMMGSSNYQSQSLEVDYDWSSTQTTPAPPLLTTLPTTTAAAAATTTIATGQPEQEQSIDSQQHQYDSSMTVQPEQQQQQQPYQQNSNYQEQQQVYYSDSPAHSSNHAPASAMQVSPTVSVEWLDNICKQLIEHMNTFGICVIDNFLGTICGEAILNEVYHLYNNGLFRRGQLVNNRLANGRVPMVRGDSIIWVDGSEKNCKQIEILIQTLDSLIINCNRMSGNNGEFDEHVINQRTKAMIACYPGNGTHYIKHIDNPNGDGRCITSIYYLNKEWDAQRDGGLLRIFPVGIDEVANIAPLFDRVLFFWSDRRNPHEVLPAQRIRFAITVWFIDSEEKLRRQQREQQQQLLNQRQLQQQQSANNLLYRLS